MDAKLIGVMNRIDQLNKKYETILNIVENTDYNEDFFDDKPVIESVKIKNAKHHYNVFWSAIRRNAK